MSDHQRRAPTLPESDAPGAPVDSSEPGLQGHAMTPEGPPIGLVMIVHGVHEHGARYAPLAERLARRGWAVVMPDLPGHGVSRGHRGDLGPLDDALRALQAAAEASTVESAPRRPRVLFGHSMGATLSLLLAERYPDAWDGVIVSGAATRPERSPIAVIPLLWLLSRVAPHAGVRRIRAEDVAVSDSARDSYGDDPLVYDGAVQARTAWTLWRAGREAEAELGAITIPILALHGGADALAAPSGSRAIGEGVASSDVTVRTYRGQGHELLNEDIRERVFDDIEAWLDERFGAGAAHGSVGDSDIGSDVDSDADLDVDMDIDSDVVSEVES